MNKTKRSAGFYVVDALLLILMLAPLAVGILLYLLTNVPSDGIEITGAKIYFTVKMPWMDLPVTEAQVNSALVVLTILFLCLFLTHGLTKRPGSIRQVVVEWIVEKCEGLVNANMGEYFSGFAPFIAAVMALSGFSSLLTLIGLFPPTSDLNIVAGWALLVFFLITYYKMKCGPLHYLKSFADPALLTPMNIISEFATPVSMAFRHYGNVLSGSVISVLVAALLQGISAMLFGWLPGALGDIPFLQIGLPAVLSIYFDVFSGLLQAFIFATLTMLYVSSAFPMDDYFARKRRKNKKNV